MFSITKILTLVAILGVVWYGFKFIGRLDRARKHKVAASEDRRRERRDASTASTDGVVDLVKDEKTGAYVTRDTRDHRA